MHAIRLTSRWLAALIFTLLAAGASAHGLSVFAWVDGDSLVIESRFSSGSIPQAGTIKLFDGHNEPLADYSINGDAEQRVPLPDWQSGIKVEVFASDGHANYWILTPDDIRTQRAGDDE